MIRRIFTVASAVSFLLLLATLLLWVRASRRPYWFITDDRQRHALVFSRDEIGLVKFDSVDSEGRIGDAEGLPSMWVQWSHITFLTALLPLLWLALDIKRRVRAADKSTQPRPTAIVWMEGNRVTSQRPWWDWFNLLMSHVVGSYAAVGQQRSLPGMRDAGRIER